MNKISIVIPILNEAENIQNLLNHLFKNSSPKNISEIIIVDGGSTDGSQNIIKKFMSGRALPITIGTRPITDLSTAIEETRITILISEKGRAKQMNLGAENAKSDILYFLHADSFPPKNFDTLIIKEIKKGNEAGCFKMAFNSNHWWLKLAGWLTQFSWKVCRGGDQSLFISKSLFNNIGGYNEDFTIYEDNDLISKLYSRNTFIVIQEWLITSARAYRNHGVWKLQYFYLRIHLKKWMGADANELNRYYKKHVCS